ncbi:hypothetical protein LDENG_00123050 [Lucifuga dentata]|nr:hypothetical protein LDENG_00123050 [Lucifuga dentata]
MLEDPHWKQTGYVYRLVYLDYSKREVNIFCLMVSDSYTDEKADQGLHWTSVYFSLTPLETTSQTVLDACCYHG